MNLATNAQSGYSVKATLQREPQLAEAYELFNTCRKQSVVVYQKSKGKDTVQMVLPYPEGFSVLPEDGGIADQSNYLMAIFDAFLVGERNAFWGAK